MANPVLAVELPDSWPSPPEWMTFTTLTEIEECPLRWCLSNADYPRLWNRKGYPRRVALRQIVGTVVHATIAQLLALLREHECESVQDSRIVSVLKSAGGFRAVIHEEILRAMHDVAENPRSAMHLEVLTEILEREYPRIRETMQQLLARTRLVPSSQQHLASCARSEATGPLYEGSFVELSLIHPERNWKGRVDLLNISNSSVEIVEFKTGSNSDSHLVQMRIYEWLWLHDTARNPGRRPANRLVVSYCNRDSDVRPLRGDAAKEFEAEIVERSANAIRQVSCKDPKARVSPDRCHGCQVRHLCTEYWSNDMAHNRSDSGVPFIDIELTLRSANGRGVWNADMRDVIRRDNHEFRKCVLLSLNSASARAGARVRVLNGRFGTADVDSQSCVITLGRESEVFIIP